MDNLIKNLEAERKLLIDTLSLRANQSDWVRVIDTCASLLVIDAKLSIYRRLFSSAPPPPQPKTLRDQVNEMKAAKTEKEETKAEPENIG